MKRRNKKQNLAVQTALITARILLCFISSRATLAGRPSALGIAVMSSAGGSAVFCYAAFILGLLLFDRLESRIYVAAAMTLVVAAKTLCALATGGRKPTPMVSVIYTGAGMIAALMIVGRYFDISAADCVYYVASAAICCLLSFFMISAENRISADGLLDISGVGGASLGVIYVAMISLMTSVDGLGLNLGRITGGVLLLCAATKYKHIGGAVCGALTTCGAVLCSIDSAGNTMLLATAGLLCGAVSAAGSFAMVLSFLIASIAGLAIIGVNPDTFDMLRDVAASSIIFSCIPKEVVSRLLNRVGGNANAVSVVGQAASSRLNFASKTLGGIRSQLDEIADVIKRKTDRADIQSEAGNKVCLECAGCRFCWNENTAETVDAFSRLECRVENTGRVTNRDIQTYLPECSRASKLSDTFNDLYQEKLYEYSNSVRAGELREVVTQQLSAMEDILDDLSHRISQMSAVDPSLSERVRAAAVRLGCKNAKACVSCDDNKNYRAELFIPNLSKVDTVKLTVAVSEILNLDMELPTATSSDGITKLTFTPYPEYKIEIGVWQSSCGSDSYCGDTVEVVELNSCESYVILSDGMGTGKRAKLDSMLASGLARKLLKTGITCRTGIRMINSVMRVKGWEESFSTVDVASFDLRRGFCELVKAGAAPAFLVRDETISTYSLDSLPLGILSETDVASQRIKLFDGDVVILASDGIGANPEKILLTKTLENLSCEKDCAEKIAAAAGSCFAPKNKSVRRDDITVAVIKVSAVEK